MGNLSEKALLPVCTDSFILKEFPVEKEKVESPGKRVN